MAETVDIQKRNDAMRAVLAVTMLEDMHIVAALRQQLKAVGINGGKEEITDDQFARFYEGWIFPADPYQLLLEDTQRQTVEGPNIIESVPVHEGVQRMGERVSGVIGGAPKGETLH